MKVCSSGYYDSAFEPNVPGILNKKQMNKISCIFIIIFAFFSACKDGNQKQIDNATYKPIVVAYLPTWKMPYTPDWDKITHLCLAFGIVQTDGSLDITEINKNKNIIKEAQEHNVKVLLSIGGGGSKNFSKAILDEESRSRLVSNLDQVIKELELDGIDIDYEEWDGGKNGACEEDLKRRTALEYLYKELRNKTGKDKLIAAAVSADWDKGDGSFGFYNCFNNSMHEYLDFISLMIYDATGPWSGNRTGPHSGHDFFVNSIDHWLNNRKLPKEKLVAGVPFYGYLFKASDDATDAQGIPYRDILERYPDADPDQTDSIGLLYYDGIPTIKYKTEYTIENQLGGIMFWEITHDTDNKNKSLLNTIDSTIKKLSANN